MRKTLFVFLLAMLAIGSVFGATAAVTLRPSQIDISSATSESAVLMTASAYTSNDARYKLYNGANQFNCWDSVTGTYISSYAYSSYPQVPGTPMTSSTWWVPFQRGNNTTTFASYRDRLGPTYSSNYMTTTLPAATSIITSFSIVNANVTFTTWSTYASKYIILGFDATTGGTLISATSSALTTGAFNLKVDTATSIRRIEVRDLLNNVIDSVIGTWTLIPTIFVSPASLSDFYYAPGAGPSTAQSFTVSGINLITVISIAASTNYEISLTTDAGYTSQLLLTPTGGSMTSTHIYVRLKAGLVAGVYNSDITASSAGATNQIVICSGSVLSQQSFEASSNDTWTYTANPLDMSRIAWWGRTDQPLGGATPQSGLWYWSSWNLQNTECSITFSAVSLSYGYIHRLSFYYFTNGLISPAEYSQYCVEYDNGTEWTNWITLNPDTDVWTQVLLDIPAYATTVRLKVIAKDNGSGKYAHWDDFEIYDTPVPPMAPLVYNTSVAQRTDGSGLVDIYYDLFDANGDAATISLLISEDGGTSYSLSPSPANLSGDLGAGIAYGTGKHIVWNAGAEAVPFDNNQYRIRILSEDN